MKTSLKDFHGWLPIVIVLGMLAVPYVWNVSVVSPASVYAVCEAEATGIENGKYGPNQVFDVQRSPAFPVAGNNFTLSSMTTPYSTITRTQYSMSAGDYIQFYYNGCGCNEGADNIGIRRYDSEDTLIATVAENGSLYGLGDEGFLHVSDLGYGTFVSNLEGFSNGDSITYVPDTGEATCLEISEYPANPEPLGDGETVDVEDIGGGPSAVCGDSTIEGDEQCDDGNTDAEDGCSDTCLIEDGYECAEEASENLCNTTGSGSVVISCFSESDCDGDGIDDEEEQGSPLGTDVNNDGRPDSQQGYIVTAVNDNVEAYTTTVVNGCTSGDTTVAFYAESELGSGDDAYEYELGLHGFEFDCGTPGVTIDVIYYWDQVYDTSTWTYRKYNSTTERYMDFSSQVTYATATVSGTTVTTVSFSITDGSMYDADGVANGTIVDPAGPGVYVPTGGKKSTLTDEEPSDETTDGEDTEQPVADESEEELTDEDVVFIEAELEVLLEDLEAEDEAPVLIEEDMSEESDLLENANGTTMILPTELPHTGASL